MTTTEQVPSTYDEAVRALAGWHADSALDGLEIYSFPDPETTTVRLVEVSDAFQETGSARPVTFGRSSEFPFRSSVVLLTKQEWQRLLDGELSLPGDWDLTQRRRVLPDERA